MTIALKPRAGDAQIDAHPRALRARGAGMHASGCAATTMADAAGSADHIQARAAVQLLPVDYVERSVPVSRLRRPAGLAWPPGGCGARTLPGSVLGPSAPFHRFRRMAGLGRRREACAWLRRERAPGAAAAGRTL